MQGIHFVPIASLWIAMKDTWKLSDMVERANEENCELNSYETGEITSQCIYLQQAYSNALESMDSESTPMTWLECCEMAVKMLASIGFDKITCG